MNRSFLAVACAGLFVAACPSFVRAQDYVQSPRTYYLHPPSSYQQGCWGPCACWLSVPETMRGTFTLNLITVGDATDFYSITNVNWTVPTLAGQPLNMTIMGSGTFGAGQVPFSAHQNMTLDLTLAPPPWNTTSPFHTTSTSTMRTVAPPVIDMEVADSTTGCPGIRLRVVASWYRSNYDANGAIGTPDIFAFVNSWFAGSAAADFDGVGGLAITDIFAFLNSWLAGE